MTNSTPARLPAEIEAIATRIFLLLDSDARQNESMPALVRALIEDGPDCDQLPNATGEFGRSPSNPIPVNGPLGEVVYLSRLTTETGAPVMFHRVGADARRRVRGPGHRQFGARAPVPVDVSSAQDKTAAAGLPSRGHYRRPQSDLGREPHRAELPRQARRLRAALAGRSAVRAALRSLGAKLFFLPPYSPDFNPIEQVFAKLKGLLRKVRAGTLEATWRGIGALLPRFPAAECAAYLTNAGYAST